jgi:ssDNA-binding Zn-finger/Zn-ribbon topoisomerase 1
MAEAKAAPFKQNVPTALACPECGGTLLIMTRKADGRRFLACRNFYDQHLRCPYTDNHLPQHLLMKEAGAAPLPGFDL